MMFLSQDDEYNFYLDIANDQILIKERYDPYQGCTQTMITAVQQKIENQVKLRAISEQVGISKYKVNRIIDFLTHGRPDDEVLGIQSLPVSIPNNQDPYEMF